MCKDNCPPIDAADLAEKEIYYHRFHALLAEIEEFEAELGCCCTKVERLQTIRNLVARLKCFAKQQFCFFVEGFYKRVTLELLDQTPKQPTGYTKEFVFGRLFRQISADLIIIRRAYRTRLHGSNKEKDALRTADKLAAKALELAMDKNNGGAGCGLIRDKTTALTYFQKTAQVRVIPYAPVAIVGIPLTCTDQTHNYRDFLAIPHEIGHYIFWHGRYKTTVPAQNRFGRVNRASYLNIKRKINRKSTPSLKPFFRKLSLDCIPEMLLQKLRCLVIAQLIKQYQLEDCKPEALCFISELLGVVGECADHNLGVINAMSELIITRKLAQIDELVKQYGVADCIEQALPNWRDRLCSIFELAQGCLYGKVINKLPRTLTTQAFIRNGTVGIKKEIQSYLGHNSEIDTVFAALVAADEKALAQGAGALQAYVARWQEEIFADVYACLVAGPVAARKMQDLLFDNYTLVEDNGIHPVPAVRPFIYTKVLKELAEEMPSEGERLDEAWQGNSVNIAGKLGERDVHLDEKLPNRVETGMELKQILEMLARELLVSFARNDVLVDTKFGEFSPKIPAWTITASEDYHEFAAMIPSPITPASAELGSDSSWEATKFYFDALYEKWIDGTIATPFAYETVAPEGGWHRLMAKSGWAIGGPEEDGTVAG